MMTLHPDIQRKAQNEVDTVVGTTRLPTMEDREDMPYLNCIIKEILRFGSIVPLMPHSLDVDDVSAQVNVIFFWSLKVPYPY